MRLMLYLCLTFQMLLAQTPTLDSLHADLQKQPPTSEGRVETLLNIAKEWQLQLADSSAFYAQRALELAIQENFITYLPKAYNHLGSAFYLQAKYVEAIRNFENGVEYAQQLNDSIYLAHMYNNIGLSYNEMGLYEEAIRYMQLAMTIRQSIEQWEDMHASLYNMALVFAYGLEDGGPSMKYANKVISYYKTKPQLKWQLAMCYNLKCYVSFKFFNDLDSAEFYANSGLALLEKDEVFASSFLYSNLGVIYLGKKAFFRSEESFKRALDLKVGLGNPSEIASGYEDFARLYLEWNKLDQAEKAIQEAFVIYDSLNEQEGIVEVLELKSKLLKKRGAYREAMEALEQSISFRDSLNRDQTARRLTWLRSLHEEDRLENENLLLTTQRDIQELRAAKEQNRRNILLIASFFLLILMLLAYSRFREKNKLSKALAKANEQLKENEARLSQLNKMKDSFFAIIGHDLKNPISAYKNIIDKLRSGGSNQNTQSDLLNELSNSADQLLNLLQNLLMWAQREQGRFKFTPRAVILHDEVETSFNMYRSVCKDRGIALENRVNEELLAMADREMLQTILRNLINNAVKFTTEGGISIQAFDKEGEVKLTISDTGAGMSKERVANLLSDVANKEVETLSETGTGLGFTLVRSFVHEHGGEIGIESEPGRGTSISFTLSKFTTHD